MNIEKHITDGFTISQIIDNQYIHQRYIGYTITEAKKAFKIYCKELKKLEL